MKATAKTLMRLLRNKRIALSKADPKSRDKVRRELRALEVARELRKEAKAA